MFVESFCGLDDSVLYHEAGETAVLLHGLCMSFIFRLFSDFLPHLCHIDLIPTVTPQWAYGVINVTGNYNYIYQLFLFSFHLVYINDHNITECVENLKLICSTRASESVSDILELWIEDV